MRRPRDGGPTTDGGGSDDGGAADPDSGATGGDSGGGDPHDAGFPMDASQPVSCNAGFVSYQGRCVPNAPLTFRDRSETSVCARWRQDYVVGADEWAATPGSSDPCDPGTLSQAGHDNAVKRTNLFRWLVGVGTVTEAVELREVQQACAVLQKAMNGLDHTPPMSAPCYSAHGAQGAGTSNLAYGGRDLAYSVDLYVGDTGVDSLGHRRWVLNPEMQETAFGYKPVFSCMYAFSRGGRVNVEWVSWPPPGYVPEQAAEGTWSFASRTAVANAGTRVEMALGEGNFSQVQHRDPGGGFGWGSTIAFDPPRSLGNVWRAGNTVRVALRGLSTGDVEYTVQFIDCP